jgi:MFS transporter
MNGGSAAVRSLSRRGGNRLPFFYGWLLVAIGFVTMAVGVNARTAFSLLFPAILAEFGWDRGVTAGAFSFGFLVSAVVTPFVRRLMDFWWLAIGYFCGLFSWYAVQVHQTKYLIEIGFAPSKAAWALGLVSLVAVPGQIALGHLSDRVGRGWVWMIGNLGFVICFLCLVGLHSAPTPILLDAMILAQGTVG